MGRFPVRSCSRNNYIMLTYHVNTNAILVKLFQSCQNNHRLAPTSCIMSRLHKHGHTVDLQILDNNCIEAYKLKIESKWGAKFQLVPPDAHCRNAAERSIRNFKAHSLSILAGVSDSFHNLL